MILPYISAAAPIRMAKRTFLFMAAPVGSNVIAGMHRVLQGKDQCRADRKAMFFIPFLCQRARHMGRAATISRRNVEKHLCKQDGSW
jgi:hypothetical protein